jgi:hypothetical protein
MEDPKSHIFERTSVNSGKTIKCFVFKWLLLMMISAVSKALVKGETKMMSIYLKGSLVLLAC